VPACADALLHAEDLASAVSSIVDAAKGAGIEAALAWSLDTNGGWTVCPTGVFDVDASHLDALCAASPAADVPIADAHGFACCARSGKARAVLLCRSPVADHGVCFNACQRFFTALRPYLVNLLEKSRLVESLKGLEQSEKLQRALFAIADMASSDLEMLEMMTGLHAIVGSFMYAENFYIALYDPDSDTIRFLYFADIADNEKPDMGTVFPMDYFERGLTWYLIRGGRPLMGSHDQLQQQVSGPLHTLGPRSFDWLGVPMSRGGKVYGALVVQSYVERQRYTEDDQALLSFVGSHILTALERRQARDELEQRVEQRTRELALANDVLTEEAQERRRAEHLQRVLYQLAELSNSAGSMEEFYRAVHVVVAELIIARNFYIALLDSEHAMLLFPYLVDERDVSAPARRPVGNGATEYVLRTRKALLADAAGIERLHAAGEIELVGPSPQSWLGVPFVCADGLMGVVAVQSYSPEVSYGPGDQRLLTFVSYQIANSLGRKRAADALKAANADLERRVAERTRELSEQIEVRQMVELALQQRNAELEAMNNQLAGAQNQLLQSEKMASVGQLAAGVAHEINNPIGYVHSNLDSLTGYLRDIFSVLDAYEKLERSLDPPPPGVADVNAIKQQVDLAYLRDDVTSLLAESVEGVTRVEKIVHDLKDFSHVDQAEWQYADLHAGLETTLNVAWHELKYKAEIVKEYGDLPLIECLPSQINQVFLNILVNAAQAMEGRGRITIRTARESDHALVAIADNGKGIDPKHVTRIFEPFFTTKPVGVGTGLGLSVSYGIVQKHGGTIEVQSELGKGTTFTLRLPIAHNRDK